MNRKNTKTKTQKKVSLAELLTTEGVREILSFDALFSVCKEKGLLSVSDKVQFRKCANNSIISSRCGLAKAFVILASSE